MQTVSRRLKNIADPGRLRVLSLIAIAGEMCVCDVEAVLGVTVSTASRNLRELESGGWLAGRREGRWMYYRLAELPREWEEVRRSLLAILERTETARNDTNAYDEMRRAGGVPSCNTTPAGASGRRST